MVATRSARSSSTSSASTRPPDRPTTGCAPTTSADPPPDVVVRPLVERILDELPSRRRPLFVGLDGRSGSGKSTAAHAVARAIDAVTVIGGDDFYAGGSDMTWDRRSAEQKVAAGIDWRRQRTVLSRLRATGSATWRAFDWDSDDWDSDHAPAAGAAITARAGQAVVLEGAYSCRPELHDLLDLLVLLDTPDDTSRARLLEREGAEYRSGWEARWRQAEDLYFGSIMTPERFHLVI